MKSDTKLIKTKGGCEILLRCPSAGKSGNLGPGRQPGEQKRQFDIPKIPDIPWPGRVHHSDDDKKKEKEQPKPKSPSEVDVPYVEEWNNFVLPDVPHRVPIELPKPQRDPTPSFKKGKGKFDGRMGKAYRSAGKMTLSIEAMDVLADVLDQINSEDITTVAELMAYLADRYGGYIPEALEFVTSLAKDVIEQHWDDAAQKAVFLTPGPAMFKLAETIPKSVVHVLGLDDVEIDEDTGFQTKPGLDVDAAGGPWTDFQEFLQDVDEKGLPTAIVDTWNEEFVQPAEQAWNEVVEWGEQVWEDAKSGVVTFVEDASQAINDFGNDVKNFFGSLL